MCLWACQHAVQLSSPTPIPYLVEPCTTKLCKHWPGHLFSVVGKLFVLIFEVWERVQAHTMRAEAKRQT